MATGAPEPHAFCCSAILDPASLDAWRGCLDSSDFRDLGADHSQPNSSPGDDGRFCAVSDLNTSSVAAGPASSGTKVVMVYDLEGNSGRFSSWPLTPPTLSDLGASVARLQRSVVQQGTPVDVPAPELTPL